MNTFEYLIKAGFVSSTLSSLLGTDFSSHRFESLPHACRINELVPNWVLGDRTAAWYELYLLEYFQKHLREVAESRPDVLQMFRKEFRRAKLEAQFFGLRFETYVAASLLRKSVSFVKSESPDFQLGGCNIECTSVRVGDGGFSKDLSYKVASAIRKKADSASHRSDCLLFIDITNLLHTSLLGTANTIRAMANATINETEFASAVLFSHMFNADLGRLQTVYFREDNDCLEGSPLEFLNTHYPIMENGSYDFHFPRSG